MTVPLTPDQRQRLTRLLGMLGSSHDGEVANAGRLADRLVRGAGLSWSDVLAPQIEHHQRKPEPKPKWDEPKPDWPPPQPTNAYTSWRRTVAAARRPGGAA